MKDLKSGKNLRSLISRDEPLIIPGTTNALTAKLIEKLGFKAAYITGYGVSARYVGAPDVGLLTKDEILANAKNIASAVNIPVFADGETGFGNAINIMRTVRDFELAGLAGLQIGDSSTETCPYIDVPYSSLPVKEMAGRIRAAVEAREDRDFVFFISCSNPVVREASKRVEAYAEAGADAFLCGWKSIDDLKLFGKTVRDAGKIAMAVMVPMEPSVSVKELQEMGYQIILYPVDSLFASLKAEIELLKELKATGTIQKFRDRLVDQEELLELVEVSEIKRLAEKFLVKR